MAGIEATAEINWLFALAKGDMATKEKYKLAIKMAGEIAVLLEEENRTLALQAAELQLQIQLALKRRTGLDYVEG